MDNNIVDTQTEDDRIVLFDVLKRKKLKLLLIFILSLVGFMGYCLISNGVFNENGRYQAVVVPYESGGSTLYRDDKLYIIDTKEGTYRQIRY